MMTFKLKFYNKIQYEAGALGYRNGQYLFNILPPGAAAAIRTTYIDPFHRDFTGGELKDWIDNHLILQEDKYGYEVIGVFDGNKILWEADNA